MVNVSTGLKEYRESANLTEKEVALFLGIEVKSYRRYEKQERTPDLETLDKLAKLYSCKVDDFFNVEVHVDRSSYISTRDLQNTGLENKPSHELIKQVFKTSDKSIRFLETDRRKYVLKEDIIALLENVIKELKEK